MAMTRAAITTLAGTCPFKSAYKKLAKWTLFIKNPEYFWSQFFVPGKLNYLWAIKENKILSTGNIVIFLVQKKLLLVPLFKKYYFYSIITWTVTA